MNPNRIGRRGIRNQYRPNEVSFNPVTGVPTGTPISQILNSLRTGAEYQYYDDYVNELLFGKKERINLEGETII